MVFLKKFNTKIRGRRRFAGHLLDEYFDYARNQILYYGQI